MSAGSLTHVRPQLASRLARPFGPRVPGRGTTEKCGVHGIVCRQCTKTKEKRQSEQKSKTNSKQIVSVTVFPWLQTIATIYVYNDLLGGAHIIKVI